MAATGTGVGMIEAAIARAVARFERVNPTYRQILRHSAVFAVGGVLFRLGSIVMLPVYTRYLQPADYAVIAILDFTINLLSIVAGGGIASAATRAHFSGDTGRHRDRVWWTGLAMQLAAVLLLLAVVFPVRHSIANATFGPAFPSGARCLAVALATLGIGSLTVMFDAYFRAHKASAFVVRVGLYRLCLNIALNVAFLVWLRQGVAGILYGNLLSACAALLIQMRRFAAERGRFVFDVRAARAYCAFGWPLVIHGLLSAAMHDADRYLLRLYVDLHELGLYSFGYGIAQGVNTLVVIPFVSIWSVLVYEIARQPDAKAVYARVFKHYVLALSLVLMAASLVAGPLLQILAPPAYGRAADVVPIVCLGYLLFSMHEHFKVPAMLANRTTAVLPVVSAAVVTNVVINLAVIPWLGTFGAAWTTVLTFAVFSVGGLLRYRRIDRYQYPLGAVAGGIAGMAATYVAYRTLIGFLNVTSVASQVAIAGGLILSWAALLSRQAIDGQADRVSASEGTRPSPRRDRAAASIV
jgi:O-antigen/teichoic acid export membrane protein